MEDTRDHREEREEVIIKSLKELAKIHNVKSYGYHIETWTKDDPEPIFIGKAGIQVTMFW